MSFQKGVTKRLHVGGQCVKMAMNHLQFRFAFNRLRHDFAETIVEACHIREGGFFYLRGDGSALVDDDGLLLHFRAILSLEGYAFVDDRKLLI